MILALGSIFLSTNTPTGQSQLQKTFIAMIFAFVISFHAQTITEYIAVITNNWSVFPYISTITIDFIAVGSQIILALLMILISWVMWSKSQAIAHLNDINQIFTIKFVTFILEILLVTLYYGLVKSLEVDFSEFSKTKNVSSYITNLSAKPEAFLMTLIFGIFLVWDLIIDIFKSPTNPVALGNLNKLKNFFKGFLVYCLISLISFLAALLILTTTPSHSSALITIFSDLALICILLFFYQAKILEYYLLKIFPDQDSRPNTKRTDPPTLWETTRVVVLVMLFIIFSVVVGICIHQ